MNEQASLSEHPTQSPGHPLAGASFGLFEVNYERQELLKAGHRIHLQTQPFEVLLALLERPYVVVTKDELRRRIWGESTNVDFDQSLSKAINKIREALSDSSDNPRFIETVPRRGYRFIAPVEYIDKQTPSGKPASESHLDEVYGHGEEPVAPAADAASSVSVAHDRSRNALWPLRGSMYALSTAIVLFLGVGLGFLLFRKPVQSGVPDIRQLTFDTRVGVMIHSKGLEGFPSLVTDGESIFTSGYDHGSFALLQASVNGRELRKVTIPKEILNPQVGAISRRTSKLLINSSSSLWIVSLDGTSAQRIPGIQAHDETWMPDDVNILYSTNNELRIFDTREGASKFFARTPGKAAWLRWSPSGDRLRFTVLDPLTHAYSLWEVTQSDHEPKRLLSNWNESSDNCCGVWMSDGSFVFQAIHNNNESDFWRIPAKRAATPERLTNGPFWFESPAASPVDNRLFFIGVSAQANVQMFNPSTKEFRPAQAFLHDAQEMDISRDGQWIAWVDGTGRLWRSHMDGSDKLQLSFDTMTVYMSRWSPDGRRIAMIARTLGQPWQLYVVRSDGGDMEQLLHEPQNDADPAWSPDGKSIVLGRMPLYLGGEEAPWTLRMLDLQTHQIKSLPGSGMFSPHWSPDGKYILALTQNQQGLLLFDVATQHWTNLLHDNDSANRFFSNPAWSADGRSIYVQDTHDIQEPVLRISVPDGHVQKLFTLQDFVSNSTIDYTFVGLAAHDTPIVRTRVNGDIYSLKVQSH